MSGMSRGSMTVQFPSPRGRGGGKKYNQSLGKMLAAALVLLSPLIMAPAQSLSVKRTGKYQQAQKDARDVINNSRLGKWHQKPTLTLPKSKSLSSKPSRRKAKALCPPGFCGSRSSHTWPSGCPVSWRR